MNVSGTMNSATGHTSVSTRTGNFSDGLYDRAGARPDLDLDFARTKSLTDRVSKEELITFTRSSGIGVSKATYVDENGLVKKAPVNFIHNSQNISQETTTGTMQKWRNYISEGSGTGTAPSLSITPNYATAPDGTMTAARLEFVSGTKNNNLCILEQRVSNTSTPNVPANTPLVLSVYLKTTDGSNQTINFSNVGRHRQVLTVTGEWQRFELKSDRENDDCRFRVGIRTGDSSGTFLNQPDSNGNYANLTRDILIWGAQVELIDSNISNGLVTGVATALIKTGTQNGGAPRFTHDPVTKESKGLLIEQATTNLVTFPRSSAGFWQTSKSTTDSNATNPDGSTPAYHNINTTENVNTFNASSANSDTLTFSVFIKQRPGSTAHQLNCEVFKQINNPANNNAYGFVNLGICARFDVSTGEFVSVVESNANRDVTNFVKEEYPNGWYRIGFTVKNKHVGEGSTGQPAPNNFDGVANTNPNFTSTARFDLQNTTAYLWGPQVEKGNVMTSYILTDTAQATRSPDIASIEGDNFGTYRTNFVTNSENFSDTSKYIAQQSMAQDYAGVSPTGNYDASLLSATTSQNIGHNIRTDSLANIETGATYTVSVHVKPTATENTFFMNFGTKANTSGAPNVNEGGMKFQLTGDGVLIAPTNQPASSSSIDKLANGWYRCQLTTNALSQNTQAKVFIKLQKNAPFVASNPPEALLIWGLQVEKSSTMTEYIPSTDTYTNRQSNATFVDANGIIRTSYANHLKYSEQLDQAAWIKSGGTSITANNVVAPDGTTTADTWSLDSTRYGFYNNTANSWMSAHSQLLYPFTITDEWVRYSIPFTTESGQTSMRVYPLRTNNNVAFVYQTDITVVPNTDYVFSAWYKKVGTKVYVWGCQLVRGTVAASYYKTTDTISGPPRYSHDPETLTPTGLYLETAATNIQKGPVFNRQTILTNSASDQRAGLNADGVLSPMGTTKNVCKAFVDGSLGSTTQAFHIKTFGGSDGATFTTQNIHTSSVFVKPINTNFWRLATSDQYASATDGGDDAFMPCDFELTGSGRFFNQHSGLAATGIPPTIEKYSNGWWRLSISYFRSNHTGSEAANRDTGVLVYPIYSNAGPTATSGHTYTTYEQFKSRLGYTDAQLNESPVTVGYFFGPQIEDGKFPTSYIPTSGEEATRSADIYTSTATEVLDRANGTKPAFYTTEGLTLRSYCKYNNEFPLPAISDGTIPSTHQFARLFHFQGNGSWHGNPTSWRHWATPAYPIFSTYSQISNLYAQQLHITEDIPVVLRYQTNNSNLRVGNGSNNTADTSMTTAKFDRVYIGSDQVGTNLMNGTINRFTIWKIPFNEEEASPAGILQRLSEYKN